MNLKDLILKAKQNSQSFFNEDKNEEFFNLAKNWLTSSSNDDTTHVFVKYLYWLISITEIREEEFFKNLIESFVIDFTDNQENYECDCDGGEGTQNMGAMLAMYMMLSQVAQSGGGDSSGGTNVDGDEIESGDGSIEDIYKQIAGEVGDHDFPESLEEFMEEFGQELVKQATPFAVNTNFLGVDSTPIYELESNVDEFSDRDFEELEEDDELDLDDVEEDTSTSEVDVVKEIVDEYNLSSKYEDENIEFSDYINTNRAQEAFKIHDYHDNVISEHVTIVLNKIATGSPEKDDDGMDFYDIDDLVGRTVDKRHINNCKYSNKKKRIKFIVDSSPSCEYYANLYSKLCMGALENGNVDIFKAPNGEIETIVTGDRHNITETPISLLTEGDINPYMTRKKHYKDVSSMGFSSYDKNYTWNFENEIIIFFGDSDGQQIVLNSSIYNKVYWFYASRESDSSRDLKKMLHGQKLYQCTSAEQFLTNVKHVRP